LGALKWLSPMRRSPESDVRINAARKIIALLKAHEKARERYDREVSAGDGSQADALARYVDAETTRKYLAEASVVVGDYEDARKYAQLLLSEGLQPRRG
jgi:hypothetical protein